MNAFKRSILYITRKKKKSLIMLFILFGIATAVLSGISIKKAATVARQDSNKGISNIFELQTNLATNFDGLIPESLVNKISKVDGIKNYDGIIGGSGMDFKNISSVDPANNMIQYNEEEYKHLFSVEGHTSTQYDTKFTSKSLRLVEGRHLVATDKNKVLIHKALAEKNKLKVVCRKIVHLS